MPAYAGTAAADETPGTISKPRPGLGAGRGLLGPGGVDERVAGHQPDDPPAALGLPDHDLGAGGVGQRLAVLAEPAVDELGTALGALGQTEQRADERRDAPAPR